MGSKSWHELEYRVHSRIGILCGARPAAQLWYACRALDVNGCGHVTIPSGEVERQLGKSRTTVWRYLNDTTFFRAYHYRDGYLTIYMHGLSATCLNLGLNGIGPVGFNVGLDSIQADAAAIGAQALQQQSKWVATHMPGKGPTASVDATTITDLGNSSFISGGLPSISDGAAPPGAILLDPLCAGTATLHTVNGLPFTVHVLNIAGTIYGASLEGIGALLHVCSKTVSRSLRNSLRVRQGQQIPMWKYLGLRFEACETLNGRNEDSPYCYYALHKILGPYRLYTYLYYPMYQLCSQKRLKARVNPYLKEQACVGRSPGWGL
jgi:hypothetical protein